MSDANLDKDKQIPLTGLRGGNLLAFLTALGTLRILSLALPMERIRMSWQLSGGAWRPVINLPARLGDNWLDMLNCQLQLQKIRECPALIFADNPSVNARLFSENETAAFDAAMSLDRTFADFMAALGSAAWQDDKKEKTQDTAFRTMQGAGHQHFLKTMRDLTDQTTEVQIRNILLENWVPSDKSLGLRWDACEDRPYAMRWRNPSSETVLTVRGANRLAIEALPLFPTVGVNKKLETTGFTFSYHRNPRLTFPIWEPPITVDTVRSLLALPEIQSLDIGRYRDILTAKGVRVIYRCERFKVGNFRNFTPVFPV